MNITAFDLADRFTGVKEISGEMHNAQILAMLKLDDAWPESDEVPWCSAFVNYVCWLLRLPRSKSLRARSWLDVGHYVHLGDAKVGFDIAVLWRLKKDSAMGHVGFYAGHDCNDIYLLGGNQNNAVNSTSYKLDRLLGIRRLYNADMC